MRYYHRDEFLTLTEAAKLLPGSPTENTLRYWSNRGTYGVRLRTYSIDGQWVTTVTDILQFIADQNREDRLPAEIEAYYRLREAEHLKMKGRPEIASAIPAFRGGDNAGGEKPNVDYDYYAEPGVW
jgi:hypothetical protein